MNEPFDGSKEPMRALRDLIVSCEGCVDAGNEDGGVLDRARAGLTTLRALCGDTRAPDTIADTEAMIEPALVSDELIDGIAEALRRDRHGLIRPLWRDMTEAHRKQWHDAAVHLLGLLHGLGITLIPSASAVREIDPRHRADALEGGIGAMPPA